MAVENWRAKWPSPPIPTTPTFLPGPAWKRFKGEKTVTPAQNNGAASMDEMASGTGIYKKGEGIVSEISLDLNESKKNVQRSALGLE